MKKAMLLALSVGLLAACSSTPRLTQEQLLAQDQSACRGYGFEPATDAFAECVMQLSLVRAANSEEERREANARIGRALAGFAAANKRTTCNTTATATQSGGRIFGSTVSGNSTTTCY